METEERVSDEPQTKAAALVVLISALERSIDPEEVAKTAKHFAFAHYGDLTFDEMVEAKIARFEAELIGNTRIS